MTAVGNVRDKDIHLREVELAKRSLNSDTFLAVMNISEGEFRCRSSIVDEQRVNRTFAVGFDGRLPGGRCGTSFSAPRVAWLLAAAAKTGRFGWDEKLWADNVSTVLKEMRGQEMKWPAYMELKPVDLLGLGEPKSEGGEK